MKLLRPGPVLGPRVHNAGMRGQLWGTRRPAFAERLEDAGAVPTFDLPFVPSGVSNLPTTLTINGTPVEASLFYRGEDATAEEWAAVSGGDLAPAGAGADFDVDQPSPLLDGTRAVRFHEGRYFESADLDLGNIGSDDFVIVYAWQQTDALTFSVTPFMGKKTTASGDTQVGWGIGIGNEDRSRFTMSDGVNSVLATLDHSGGVSGPWPWVVVVLCGDRNEPSVSSLRGYIDGKLVGVGFDISAVGDIDGDVPFHIGQLNTDAQVAFLGMWRGPDLFDGGAANNTEMDRIALEVTTKLTGAATLIAEGTPTPSVLTRTTTALLDTYDDVTGVRSLHRVGDNWPRVCRRRSASGEVVTGYLAEQAATQHVLETDNLLGSTWTTALTSFAATAAVEFTPDTSRTVWRLSASVGNGQHQFHQNTGYVATAAPIGVSIWARKVPGATNDWLIIRYSDTSSFFMSFNVATGEVGTGSTGSGGAKGYVEDWGDGWLRLITVGTNGGTPINFRAYTSNVDAGFSYNEAVGGEMVDLCCPQFEYRPGLSYASSFVENTSAVATASRGADVLRYLGDDGNVDGAEGTARVEYLSDLRAGAGFEGLMSVSDGGSATEKHELQITSSDQTRIISNSGGVTGAVTTGLEITDGESHVVRYSWAADALRLYVDGVDRGSDDAPPLPDDLDRIEIGMNRDGSGGQPGGLIRRVTIYDRPLAPGAGGTSDDLGAM